VYVGEWRMDEVGSLDVHGQTAAWLLTALLVGASPEAREVPIQRPGEGVELVLDWQAPAGCPDREAIVAELRELLPELPNEIPVYGTARLRVQAQVGFVEGQADPWTVELTTVAAEGTRVRSFAARRCEDVADATVLIVAVTLNPVAVASGLQLATAAASSEAPSELPEPETTQEAPEPELQPRSTSGDPAGTTLVLSDEAPPTRARAPRVGLRLFGTGAYGPTNTGYGGIGGSVALIGRRWRWDVAAAWSIPRLVRLDDGRGGSFDGWWVGSHGCFVPTAREVEFPLCAGFEAGQIRGRGRPPTTNTQQATLPWLAPMIGQGFAWAPIERLALGLDLALLIPIGNGGFVIDDVQVQRLPPVGARALLGIELRLP
jgi:hypothetical protein